MMGRITWESLPFPLPGRPNLVLTRDKNYKANSAELFHSPIEMIGRAYELAGELGVDEMMVIGGAKIYKMLLPYCDRMYISEVDVTLDGDAFFPEFNEDSWALSASEHVPKSSKDDHSFDIKTFDRVSPDAPSG